MSSSVPATGPALAPRARLAAAGRPFEDPECGGCLHLPLLRALRRAGLAADGVLGCEVGCRTAPPGTPARRRALLIGVAAAADPPALVARAAEALICVADRGSPRDAAALAGVLAQAGIHVVILPADASARAAEALVAQAAASTRPAAVVALAPCAADAPRHPPLAILPSRCLRCGACLGLGCVAISDPGGEALVIDPGRCTGCERCAPLCRSDAIGLAAGGAPAANRSG